MTQEDKDLLLRDLCSRLPYGVKCKVKYYDDAWNICSINPNGVTFVTKYTGYPVETNWENCKPYLFPLSSMTEEQKKTLEEINPEFYSLICWDGDIYISNMNIQGYDWLNKNHFDYRGLIPKGLANDATGKNIY